MLGKILGEIHIYIYTHIYVPTCIYRETETEREAERGHTHRGRGIRRERGERKGRRERERKREGDRKTKIENIREKISLILHNCQFKNNVLDNYLEIIFSVILGFTHIPVSLQ